ncbi:MAG: hypothetical protein QM715_02890 [Nibricoccus sp.]
MKHVQLKLDEKTFNLLWRSLHDRETVLLEAIANEPKDSDEAALVSNDLVYLRLYKAELEKTGQQAKFPSSAFSLDDGTIDLKSFT